MHDLTRCYRVQPPCRLRVESDNRRESFPDFVQVQHSRLLHLLLQSKHGVHFVAAVSESYPDFVLSVFPWNVNSISTVCTFFRVPRIALLLSFLIDVPALARLGLARFHIWHDST